MHLPPDDRPEAQNHESSEGGPTKIDGNSPSPPADLELLLRATVRRALAEQVEFARHLSSLRWHHRLMWRLQALFSSRTYDDLVFEKTHRYRVEEVFLFLREGISYLSHASSDASRHISKRAIKHDLDLLLEDLLDESGELKSTLSLPNRLTGIVRHGKFCFLVATLRGVQNPLAASDLDFALRQLEEKYHAEFSNGATPPPAELLRTDLEGCLLIQAPAPPR